MVKNCTAPYSPIPGKALTSFRSRKSVQKVNNIDDISKYVWNKISNENQHKYEVSNKKLSSIWNLLSAESIEELTLLYLQIKKGCRIYSSTVKTNTPTFECTMVNSKPDDVHHVYPQVKSGDEEIDVAKYTEILKKETNAEVYLFAVSQKYLNKDCDKRVHCMDINDLNNFMKEYYDYLPDLTKYWIKIYKEINHLK